MNNDIEKPFMEVVTNKIEKQDEKIAGLEERIKKLPDSSEDIGQIKKDIAELKVTVKNISFPIKEMRELSGNLVGANTLLKQPVEQKIIHHHYMDKALCGCHTF